MSQFAGNNIYKKQNDKLLPATYKKAVISAININAFTVDVYFTENPTVAIYSVPLASHIDPSKILVNDKCRVDLFDETNNRSMVVAYIYGRRIV